MSGLCSTVPQGAGFISSTTAYIDCQAQALGSGAWAALSAPGSTLAVVLSGFLTIFIALIGYNLLLGRSMTVRSGTLAFVKIGAVFALATSWPAYRTLVYDLVVDGPGQLVSEIGPRAGVVGSDGTLLERLDLTDHAFVQLAILGPGMPPPSSYQQVPPSPFGGFDAFALGGSRILFLLTAIAGLTVVRIVAGLALALGPFFIAFLLFDNTRSLFEGWVRVLAGAALASVAASIVLGLELALMEPWLSDVLARRMAGEALPTVSTELFVLTCLFAIVVTAALIGCARLAYAFRLAPLMRAEPASSSSPSVWPRASESRAHDGFARETERERSRAAAMASAIAAASHRDSPEFASMASAMASPSRAPDIRVSPSEAARSAVPLGRSFSRRSASRVSARASKRDAAS
jgi:type IV secretion system protein VirB6